MKGLYLHIPFCAQKCHYCNFVITLDRRPEFRERFFKALEAEILHAASRYGRLIFDTVYLGGGTPSLLSAEEMARAIENVKKNFEIKPGAEFTCEFNPGDADAEKIAAFRDLGINRVSLGVQAFQDPIVRAANRNHTVQETCRTVEMLRVAGISNLSFDLISGLPGQTEHDFETSLRRTAELDAKQLSFYDLEIHDNTPWGHEKQKGSLGLLNEEGRARNYQRAVDIMTSSGYVQYEISTFAKPGFESRHNLIYWRNQEYLGLGPGAYSYLDGVRYQTAPDMGRYLFKCENADFAPDTEDRLTEEEKETETFMTGLRLPGGVDLAEFPIIRGHLEPLIQTLVLELLLSVQGTRICLTAKGRALVESVFKFLFTSGKK